MKWGIFYNYFRDYDPITGRYVESDPIGLDGGLNTYGYVGGSPLGAVDPKGLYASILLRLPQILAEAAALGVGIYHEINDDESTSIPQSKPKDEQCDRDELSRCKKVKNQCIAQCSESSLPTNDFGWKFQKCVNKCLKLNGCL